MIHCWIRMKAHLESEINVFDLSWSIHIRIFTNNSQTSDSHSVSWFNPVTRHKSEVFFLLKFFSSKPYIPKVTLDKQFPQLFRYSKTSETPISNPLMTRNIPCFFINTNPLLELKSIYISNRYDGSQIPQYNAAKDLLSLFLVLIFIICIYM